MLHAPPAVGHIDDGHVESAEDAEDGGQRLHLRPGGKAAQQQVADINQPQNEGGGQPRVPGPPDAPDEHHGAEDHTHLGAGQGPGVGDLRPGVAAAAETQIANGAGQRDGEEEKSDHRRGHMVEDDAIEFALPAQPVVRGGDVDGLVEAPDQEGDSEGGVEAEEKFFHGESSGTFLVYKGHLLRRPANHKTVAPAS